MLGPRRAYQRGYIRGTREHTLSILAIVRGGNFFEAEKNKTLLEAFLSKIAIFEKKSKKGKKGKRGETISVNIILFLFLLKVKEPEAGAHARRGNLHQG